MEDGVYLVKMRYLFPSFGYNTASNTLPSSPLRPHKMILSIETTEKYGSVALVDGEHCLREIRLTERSAKSLAPALSRLLSEEHCQADRIDAVAVVVGPGSFTGLRIGVATAKAFAYALGTKIIAVNTMATVAADFRGAGNSVGFLSIGVDAQRGEVAAQTFELSPQGVQPLSKCRLIPADEWWAEKDQYPAITFSGPALERFGSLAPDGVTLADKSFWMPRASVAGCLAAARLAAGETDDLWSLVPIYSRPSAAEERQNKECRSTG